MTFVADRRTFDSASSLMMLYGSAAVDEAGSRARVSRDRGNLVRFCHWRQVTRMIETLSEGPLGQTLH